MKEEVSLKFKNIERRLAELEKLIIPRRQETIDVDSLVWLYVSEHEVNDALIESILSLYSGRNTNAYEEFFRSLFPASVYILVADTNRAPLAAIVVRVHPCGKHIKLEIHSSKQIASAVAKKYIELLQSEEVHFCELGNSQIEMQIREDIDNIRDPKLISFLSQIGRSKILSDLDDPRRISFCLPNGSPAPLGSYLTNSNKRLCLYGPRLEIDEEKQLSTITRAT